MRSKAGKIQYEIKLYEIKLYETRGNVLLDPQQRGNIYIVGCVLLVPDFVQKIKKMCHAVQKIFLKKSILGPKFDLLTLGGPGQEFP